MTKAEETAMKYVRIALENDPYKKVTHDYSEIIDRGVRLDFALNYIKENPGKRAGEIAKAYLKKKYPETIIDNSRSYHQLFTSILSALVDNKKILRIQVDNETEDILLYDDKYKRVPVYRYYLSMEKE